MATSSSSASSVQPTTQHLGVARTVQQRETADSAASGHTRADRAAKRVRVESRRWLHAVPFVEWLAQTSKKAPVIIDIDSLDPDDLVAIGNGGSASTASTASAATATSTTNPSGASVSLPSLPSTASIVTAVSTASPANASTAPSAATAATVAAAASAGASTTATVERHASMDMIWLNVHHTIVPDSTPELMNMSYTGPHVIFALRHPVLDTIGVTIEALLDVSSVKASARYTSEDRVRNGTWTFRVSLNAVASTRVDPSSNLLCDSLESVRLMVSSAHALESQLCTMHMSLAQLALRPATTGGFHLNDCRKLVVVLRIVRTPWAQRSGHIWKMIQVVGATSPLTPSAPIAPTSLTDEERKTLQQQLCTDMLVHLSDDSIVGIPSAVLASLSPFWERSTRAPFAESKQACVELFTLSPKIAGHAWLTMWNGRPSTEIYAWPWADVVELCGALRQWCEPEQYVRLQEWFEPAVRRHLEWLADVQAGRPTTAKPNAHAQTVFVAPASTTYDEKKATVHKQLYAPLAQLTTDTCVEYVPEPIPSSPVDMLHHLTIIQRLGFHSLIRAACNTMVGGFKSK